MPSEKGADSRTHRYAEQILKEIKAEAEKKDSRILRLRIPRLLSRVDIASNTFYQNNCHYWIDEGYGSISYFHKKGFAVNRVNFLQEYHFRQ